MSNDMFTDVGDEVVEGELGEEPIGNVISAEDGGVITVQHRLPNGETIDVGAELERFDNEDYTPISIKPAVLIQRLVRMARIRRVDRLPGETFCRPAYNLGTVSEVDGPDGPAWEHLPKEGFCRHFTWVEVNTDIRINDEQIAQFVAELAGMGVTGFRFLFRVGTEKSDWQFARKQLGNGEWATDRSKVKPVLFGSNLFDGDELDTGTLYGYKTFHVTDAVDPAADRRNYLRLRAWMRLASSDATEAAEEARWAERGDLLDYL